MHKRLKEIIKKTKEDLLKRKKQESLSVILNKVKDIYSSPAKPDQNDNVFYRTILKPRLGTVAIIAEIKLASPNEDELGQVDGVENRAREYEQAGADAISVVTEKHFFKGSTLLIKKIKDVTVLPVLQKDFIIDPYQLYESKIAGADAILLIAKILSKGNLFSLVDLAKDLNIEPVVEINNQEDLKKAVETQTNIIAVNARDLDTFEVNVERVCKLLKRIPDNFIKLGFSGIHSRVEVEKYKQAGAKAVLVGTELMRTNDIDKSIKELTNVS